MSSLRLHLSKINYNWHWLIEDLNLNSLMLIGDLDYLKAFV